MTPVTQGDIDAWGRRPERLPVPCGSQHRYVGAVVPMKVVRECTFPFDTGSNGPEKGDEGI